MKYLVAVSFIIMLINNVMGQTLNVQWSFDKEKSSVVEGLETMYVINGFNFIVENSKIYKAEFTVEGYENYNGAIEVFDLKYEKINREDFDASRKISLSKKQTITTSIGKGRDKFIHRVTLNPIICEGNNCKKIISFSVKEKLGATRASKIISRKTLNFEKTNSVLQSGDWKRVIVDTTGVFQVTSGLLRSLGYNPNTIDPNNVRVFGYGGKSLPLLNSDNNHIDPPEVAVDVIGGGDGSFGENDRVYFYAVGNKGFSSDNDSYVNPYSDVTYYYINVTSGIQSKRVAEMFQPAGVAVKTFDSFDYQTFYEKDVKNLEKQGREWFDEDIDVELSKSYRFYVPERINNDGVSFSMRIAGNYSIRPLINFNSNLFNGSKPVGTLTQRGAKYFVLKGGNYIIDDVINKGINDVVLNLNFDKQGDPSSILNLDYINLSAKCKLQGLNRQFSFVNQEQAIGSGVAQYTIANAQGIDAVWDISDQYTPRKRTHDKSSNLLFKVQLGSESNYIAFGSSNVLTPRIPSSFNVNNQNIKGTIFLNDRGEESNVDYLIITHSKLLPAAQRLANFRKGKGLNAKILTVESIFSEFSNGQQDIVAIKNAIRYVYQNATSDSNRLKFVCFFGTPSYDYKNRIEGNVNLVPIYHTQGGSSGTLSFPSDDFYVMMDENEGISIGTDIMDIAVGRIIAEDLNVANLMVDKIIDYSSSKVKDAWKRNITFISDDPDSGKPKDGQLQVMLNFVADRLKTDVGRARVNKLLADAFEQVATSGGARYPELEKEIINSFSNGSLITFYLGHGGIFGLANESIFTSKTAVDLTNLNRPNIFVTVTCELTRLDNPVELSTGELLFLNRRGGSTALITTVRDISLSVALRFYPIFIDESFDDNKKPLSIGESLMLTKWKITSATNKRSIFCVGDPALVPGLPFKGVNVAKINGDSEFNTGIIESEETTNQKKRQVLQGLGETIIEGSVLKSDLSAIDTSFEGVATVSVFGKERLKRTLANDGSEFEWIFNETNLNFPNSPISKGQPHKIAFGAPGKLLFNGRVSVREGKFSAKFIMPKNVDEVVGEGVISIYAEDVKLGGERLDVETVMVGGLNENAPEDLTPPQIEIFLNDENFQEGQLVGAEPLIIARFSDDSGINSAGGIGHDIIAIIDGDEANPVVLNEFYNSEIDDFTRGRVEYRLLGLGDGDHTIEIRVSDTYNNVASKEISFSSANSNDFNIERVLNYPNPFTSKTGFWFSHTGSISLELEVFVQVFTITGKVVKSLRTAAPVSGQSTYEGVLMWDGKDDFGQKIGKGTYLYKISVKSPLLNKTVTKIEKLVIL